jgi:hypothetical protein
MNRSTIGGVLDLDALSKLHFHTLSTQEQQQAIRRMASDGQGDSTIAMATGLSREMVRKIIGERA